MCGVLSLADGKLRGYEQATLNQRGKWKFCFVLDMNLIKVTVPPVTPSPSPFLFRCIESAIFLYCVFFWYLITCRRRHANCTIKKHVLLPGLHFNLFYCFESYFWMFWMLWTIWLSVFERLKNQYFNHNTVVAREMNTTVMYGRAKRRRCKCLNIS